MSKPWIAVFVVATLMCQANVVNANHIDFFTDGGFFANTSHVTGFVSSVDAGDPGNVIGGEREASIDVVDGVGFVSVGTMGAAMGPGAVGPDMSQTLLFSNSVSAVGQLELTYDGVGSGGLGGLDFETDWDAIAVHVTAVQGSGEVTVTATDAAAASGSVTLPVASSGALTFPFADFGGVNFGSLDALMVTLLTVDPASDFEIAAITREVIPEPSGRLLLLAAIPLAWSLRRRRA